VRGGISAQQRQRSAHHTGESIMALLIHHAVMRAAPHMPTSEVFARRKMLGETFVRLMLFA